MYNNKDDNGFWALLSYTVQKKADEEKSPEPQKPATKRRVIKRYALGDAFPGIRFTRREAECIVQISLGKTFSKAAEAMCISRRTAEYYANSCRNKLNCSTKNELVETVAKTTFFDNIDFT